jgi:large subunit ribosomal protein L25
MKKHTLNASKRTLVGRKVKQLRKAGLVPATIYGKKIESVSISVNTDEFKKLYSETGETGLVELMVEKDMHPVLIHNVQVNPVSGAFVHIEFYHVDLKVKVKANVPLELVGESQAVKDKSGVLLQVLNEIEVEALPAEIPEKIEVSVDKLAKINDELFVSDLKIPAGVELLTEKTQIVVRVSELVSKAAEAEEKAEVEAADAAKAESSEAAAPAETADTKSEEKAKES